MVRQQDNIAIQGKEYSSLESAARAYGKSRNTVAYRISKGWTPEQAVGVLPPPSFAAKTPGIPVKVAGLEFKNLKAAAKYHNRAYTHVIGMLKKGRSIEQALGLVKRPDTLQTENPQLASQWHPSKNAPLTPNDVSPGSGKKVWWRCPNNHEWVAAINSRNQGVGCAYCAGQRPTKERNFATAYPELVKEIDWTKNTNFDPLKVTPRANQKIWWKCDNGHSWQATITNRTRRQFDNACPYCLNRKLGDHNSLAQLRPDIAKDWHPTKNHPITPADVVAGGSKKFWWQCKHGHEWQTTVGLRVHSGSGCPKCSLQTSRIEIAVYSEIHALFSNVSWQEKIDGYECDIFLGDKKVGIEIDGVYWHRRRPNVDVIKSKLFEKKGIQLFRLREEGLSLLSERDIAFKWSDDTFPIISKLVQKILEFTDLNDEERASLVRYIQGGSLVNEGYYRKIVSYLPAPPPGLSLADKFPEIAKEWAYDLNAPLTPVHFKPAASKNVWWRCSAGHTWKTSLNNRVSQQTGCPECKRPKRIEITEEWNFAAKNPELVCEWHQSKNGDVSPADIRPLSNSKFWWICKHGHEWQATASSRSSGSGCPYCYGRFASKVNNLEALHPEVLAEWDFELNQGLKPSKLTAYSNRKVWWRCKKDSNHVWSASVYNRTKIKSGCPHCARNGARKYSIDYFHEFAARHGGRCLTTKYLQGKTKMKMVCKDGHEWTTRADEIQYEQKWCPTCKREQSRVQLRFMGLDTI